MRLRFFRIYNSCWDSLPLRRSVFVYLFRSHSMPNNSFSQFSFGISTFVIAALAVSFRSQSVGRPFLHSWFSIARFDIWIKHQVGTRCAIILLCDFSCEALTEQWATSVRLRRFLFMSFSVHLVHVRMRASPLQVHHSSRFYFISWRNTLGFSTRLDCRMPASVYIWMWICISFGNSLYANAVSDSSQFQIYQSI